MGNHEVEDIPEEYPKYEIFTVKSTAENIIVNVGLIAIVAVALLLSMLLLPHMLKGLTWDGP